MFEFLTRKRALTMQARTPLRPVQAPARCARASVGIASKFRAVSLPEQTSLLPCGGDKGCRCERK